MEVRRVFNCLFENEDEKELVHVFYKDMDGYIVYEECMDPLQTKRKLTVTQFYERYTRVWEQ
ncbi:hypothetical protein ACFQ38_16305 [Sporosarcina contaminans]|uniref:Uncharacterized protein n=1 Tax=Sporosarcina contaminans TaxID=633403 RepID=A0ABW3U0V0_9BACL